MAEAFSLPTTQRAYTLRLCPAIAKDDSPDDIQRKAKEMHDALWATHEALNKGAKVFGDWLLTLRGGVSHELAAPPPPPKHKKRSAEETAAMRKQRRILLALCWLSVEDERGAPRDAIIAYGNRCRQNRDNQESRDRKVEEELRKILSGRVSADEIDSWVRDCISSLKVRIRDCAVWVNRSACFDRLDGALTQDAVWDLLKPLFGSPEKMLAPAALGEDEDQTDQGASQAGDDKSATSSEQAVAKEGGDDDDAESGGTGAKDFVKKAGRWLSLRYKTEGGADYAAVADRYDRIAQAVGAVSNAVRGSELIGNIAQSLERAAEGRDGIVRAVGYTGSKQRGAFFSRLKEIEPTKSYTAGDLQPLLESARNSAAKLRQASAARVANPKGPRPWSIQMLRDVADANRGCGFHYDSLVPDGGGTQRPLPNSGANGGANHREYSVMLDHAMRRVSIAHSWIKRAEAARAKFETDGRRIERVPAPIRDWLDEFFRQRGTNANAAEGYSVRRRALGGKHAKAWKAVVAAWQHCSSEDERRQAVGQVQSDWDDDEKFGHPDLFIALADDDAVRVWNDGPQALIDYVAAKDAESRIRRYKVPAYRHPEAYHNPVFTDFGDSRWRVEYEAHKVRNRAAKAEVAVELKRRELAAQPANTASRRKAESALKSAVTRLNRARAGVARLGESAKIRLRLWNGREFVWSEELSGGITWRSSRLRKDLAMNCTTDARPPDSSIRPVTRADRLGRASVRAANGDDLSVANVFVEKHWNARLQAPRRELERRAKLLAKGKPPGLLKWFVTFSPRLEPRGPFVEYAEKHGIPLDQKANGDGQLIQLAPDPKRRKRNEWRGLAYPFWHPDHKEGTIGHAKLLLSRLRDLRVLSVDLGHRFAAACAVWETLSNRAMKEEIAGREIVAGGAAASEIYCHTRHFDKRGKQRTTIYRRIGPDELHDGSEHPAPWARLDRQFFIKLQGEERPARAASNRPEHGINETAMVAELAKALGLLRQEPDANKGGGVHELMRRAVRIATLALKRHARRAKVAYAFKPDCAGIPGIGGKLTPITPGDEAHVRFLTEALLDWHSLAVDTEWDPRAARELWNEHIPTLPHGFAIGEPASPHPNAERPTRKQRRELADQLRKRLEPIAKHLAQANPASTAAMHRAWSRQWGRDDGQFAVVAKVSEGQKGPANTVVSTPATGWHAHLRLLTDWIMGRHLPGAASKQWNRNVGGLSLTRVATMRSLYQLHKAFAMRPRPDKVQGAPEKGESSSGVAQSILDAMERMREQRVKQIANRIVEAALGVGKEQERKWDEVKKKWRCPKRPRELLHYVDEHGEEHGDPRFKACHAVVIENLRNYRPDELQTRRENRGLMNWSAGKVRKYLEEACQLHGLHLREVIPNYTSRQCSRTGLPGVRCVDVPVDRTTGEPRAYWWNKALSAARKKVGDRTDRKKEGDAESRFIVDLAERLGALKSTGQTLPRFVRIPRKGGDLFVAAPACSCGAEGHSGCPLCDSKRAVQADLNAAANIGLRALLDPDFPGKWWYVPCHPETRNPSLDKVKGGILDKVGPLQVAPTPDEPAGPNKTKGPGRRRRGKSKESVNLWRDPAASTISGAAAGETWYDSVGYWNRVKARVVRMLRQALGVLAE